ncbi:MAG TPA: galactosyldiacylglycerol synthase [Opitutaceae bacterium]|nr:galactosyldiacylglycerol synthase [Opitutaceae bacterium]
MTKLLILTAGFGEGHNAAARNLATAGDSLHGPGTTQVVDLFALTSPRFNRFARRGYLAAINRTPGLWSGFYRWVDRHEIFPRHLWLMRHELRRLELLVQREQPAVVCSTFPAYGFLLERLARTGRLATPFYNVVTDSISINSLWSRPACTGWFVPNEETAEVMRGQGVPTARLHVLGFPVPTFFGEHVHDLAPPDLAAGAAPRVLYIVHSGVRHAWATARQLLGDTDWELTFAVGRDERLRRRLERLAAERRQPTQILGWTDEVPRLLMTHHVVISKAGGATTQEAIAARCPMLVNQVVPGQEEGNYELLRRRRVGALVETPDAVVDALRQAFADQGAVWRQWRDALAPLARPDASRAIAAQLLSRVAPPPVVATA